MALQEYSIVRLELVRRERRLPLPGEVLVEKGEQVEPDIIVAQTEYIPGDPYVVDLRSDMGLKRFDLDQMRESIEVEPGQRVAKGQRLANLSTGLFSRSRTAESPVDGVVEYVSAVHARILIREEPQSAEPVVVVNVARHLDVWPAMVRMYLRYREGQKVEQGAILAASPGSGGMDYAYAPATGTIERVDVHNGLVYIVRPQQVTRVTAYISGEVVEIIPDEGVVVQGQGLVINGVFGLGRENYGELLILGEAGERVSADNLGDEVAGRIVAVPGPVDADVFLRAEELGARGLIVGGADEMDLVEYLGEEVVSGITGDEPIDMTVILTEGFGRVLMSPEVFEVLRNNEGSLVSVNGRTQVRAGAQRPEIVIPASAEDGRDVRAGVGAEEADPQPGQLVRIITTPHFGAFGEIVEVFPTGKRYETEAELPSVRVRLRDGKDTVIPIMNVEFFSGPVP